MNEPMLQDHFSYIGDGSNATNEVAEESKITMFRAIAVLTNTITGLGLLTIAYCFRIGLVLNFLMMIVLAVLSTISFSFLIDSSEKSGFHDFTMLIIPSFGKKYTWIPNAIMGLTLFGVSILYCQYFASMISSVLQEIPGVPSWVFSKWFLVFIPVIFIDLPLVFLPSISSLSYVSLGSLVLVGIFIVHSVYYFGVEVQTHGFNYNNQLKLFDFSKLIIPALAIQATSFNCHPNVFPTLIKLENGTPRRKLITMIFVVIIAFLIYGSAGSFTYMTLYDTVDGPVSLAYYKKGQVFTLITKGLYSILLVLTVPLILWACRLSANDFFFKNQSTKLQWNITGCLILISAALLAVVVQKIVTFFQFVGGVSSPLMVYILPALYYIRICRDGSRIKRFLAYSFVIIGIVFIIICLYDSIKSLVK